MPLLLHKKASKSSSDLGTKCQRQVNGSLHLFRSNHCCFLTTAVKQANSPNQTRAGVAASPRFHFCSRSSKSELKQDHAAMASREQVGPQFHHQLCKAHGLHLETSFSATLFTPPLDSLPVSKDRMITPQPAARQSPAVEMKILPSVGCRTPALGVFKRPRANTFGRA